MKNFLFIALCLSCLCSCLQEHNLAGEYLKVSKSGSVQYVLKLYPEGTFQFNSYAVRQMDGNNLRVNGSQTTEPGTSGRGTWRTENNVIYFKTNPDTDIDYNYTLNFNGTKAKFKTGPPAHPSDEKATAKLEFFDSGIFWMDGITLEKTD